MSDRIVLEAGESRDDFLAKHHYPFLLIHVVPTEEDEAQFMTVATGRADFAIPAKRSLVPVRKRPGANTFSFISIGRAANNDVVIEHSTASKSHAIIARKGDSYTIADARSKNGTFLGDSRLDPHKPVELSSGNVISLSLEVRATFLSTDAGYEWLSEERLP